MRTECVQTQGSSHEESDSDYIGVPLVEIFGYDIEDIGEIVLGKIGGISMPRSSGTGR
jgi:hypothetical protein